VIRLRQDYDAGHRIIEEQFGVVAPSSRPTTPTTINVDTVQMLDRPQHFAYRGQKYTIQPIAWLDGIALEYVNAEIIRLLSMPLTRETLLELEGHFVDGESLMWKLVRPTGWWPKRFRRNPFTTMTMAEFVAIVSFCFECRMLLPDLSLDVLPGRAKRASRIATILPTAWRSSHGRSDAGLGKMDGRAVITISGSASAGLKSSTAESH
jgi:hypothetical protein